MDTSIAPAQALRWGGMSDSEAIFFAQKQLYVESVAVMHFRNLRRSR